MTTKIPEILIGTVVIVVKQNKVMLGKRKNSYRSGWYGLPGGRVEDLEKLIECAKRELYEETAITAKKLEYMGAIRDLQKGYSFTHFAFLYKDEFANPRLKEPEKCEGWNWYKINKIPSKTLPGHAAAIDMFLKPKSPRMRDISSY